MKLETFNTFADQADANGVVFYHSGLLDEGTMASIGALLRRRLHEEGANGAQTRKVFATFMEMAQNILHYADGADGKSGTLCVNRTGEGFDVMCGNHLASSQVARVRQRLEAVQGMAPDQVRQAYRRQLASDQEDANSKGAGLGLLTMAASARAPIEFVFDPDPPLEDGKTFLFLKAVI